LPPNPSSPAEEWVIVARIVRPQGRHGEALGELLTDFPERFAERKRLYLLGANSAPCPIELERHWLHHQGRIVLKFAGIDSINDVETLRGLEVAIPKAERAPLDDGAVYIADLIGCTLIDSRTATEAGKIIDVDRDSTATPLLVIQTAAKQEALVPFAKAFHPTFDPAAKQLTMELPEGLLELNSPSADRPKSEAGIEGDGS
jgi:16S rRNA processing protein RimM